MKGFIFSGPQNSIAMQKRLIQISESDHTAFTELYDLFYDRLYAFVRAMVRDKDGTKDVLSEVFITLWNNRTSLPYVRNIQAYIYVVSRNQALLYLKKKKKRNSISLEEAAPALEWRDSFLTSGEQLMIQKELEEVMNQAIEALPPRCKMVFYLVRISKLSYKEVAEILTISEGTVHAQLSIAMVRLKEVLKTFQSAQHAQRSVNEK